MAGTRWKQNFSVSNRCCELTMFRMVKRGKRMPGWVSLLLGELLRPFPSASIPIMQ